MQKTDAPLPDRLHDFGDSDLIALDRVRLRRTAVDPQEAAYWAGRAVALYRAQQEAADDGLREWVRSPLGRHALGLRPEPVRPRHRAPRWLGAVATLASLLAVALGVYVLTLLAVQAVGVL